MAPSTWPSSVPASVVCAGLNFNPALIWRNLVFLQLAGGGGAGGWGGVNPHPQAREEWRLGLLVYLCVPWVPAPPGGAGTRSLLLLSPTPRCVARGLSLPHVRSECCQIPGRFLTVGRWDLRESPGSGHPRPCAIWKGMQALGPSLRVVGCARAGAGVGPASLLLRPSG